MKEYHLIIPDEEYRIIEFKQDGFPGIAFINIALRDFGPKEVFSWHLSIIIDFEDLIENGMPSHTETDIVDPFGDYLDSLFKGLDKDKPNALFLGRVTWNATRQLMWRVYEPEMVNQELQKIIEKNEHPREFDYRIEEDSEWAFAKWYLTDYKT